MFLDAIVGRGRDLFRVARQRDLEGIVAKWCHGTYQTDGRSTSWLKIKNPNYSQIVGRHELFERRSIEGWSRRPRRRSSYGKRTNAGASSAFGFPTFGVAA
jgi:hypothetical protein